LDRRAFLRVAIIILISLLGSLTGGLWAFLKQAKFGGKATSRRLERIRRSPNFRNGQFQNLLDTPMMTGEKGGLMTTLGYIFNRNKRRVPTERIPSVREDLKHLDPAGNHFVWFGHSSYLLQVEGKRILVDPVLSGRASPVSFTTKAFDGTDPYTVADLPEIDYLFITHDHWDHLDYETVTKLRPKVKKVICGLGVGAHFEKWGYAPGAIIEGDWGDSIALGDGFTVEVLPARHFSGRSLQRNLTLWASYAVRTARGYKVFVGGDGGYGPHFKEIGKQSGGFDLAMLENGQYDTAWKYVHMMPEETLQAGRDIGARLIVPVHNSKFCISNHDWDAPVRSITALAGAMRPELITPVIGRVVQLEDPAAGSSAWWTSLT